MSGVWRNPQACFESAATLLQARLIPDALSALADAERFGFDPDQCSAARWDCFMFLGRFTDAWAESDAIARRGSPDPHRFWDGQPFHQKRVILRCLHGLGDTIQFIRYAPLIRGAAARLIVETHPPLVRLLRHVRGVDEVITWGADAPHQPPEWDTQVEINELPRIFATTLRTIPAEVPYLHVPLELSAPKPSQTSRKIVGVNWESSAWNQARSIPGPQFAAALNDLPFAVRSLQYGPHRALFPPVRLTDGDILDAAIDMLPLDLIITVDTMTAHLAGALGKPVWVLLPFEADWRWMLDRNDSPWYPTMRLFRQRKQGDWQSALQELRRAALAL